MNQMSGITESERIATSPEEVLFEDDFNSENSGKGQADYHGLRNWQITSGTVDLADSSNSNQYAQNGLWLELHGVLDEIGTFKSNKEFSFSAGMFRLELEIGCQSPCAESKVKLALGKIYSEILPLPEKAGFQTIEREILVWDDATAGCVFHFQTTKNAGIFLDNIRLVKFSDGNEVFNYVPPLDSKKRETLLAEQHTEKDDGKTSYFGVAFTKHTGEGIKILGVLDDMPAQQTGLRADDLILEVEDVSFRDKGSSPLAFSEMMRHMSSDKPLRFNVEREGKRFDVWITPLRLDHEQLAAAHEQVREKFGNDYSKGRRMMAQGNYAGAIEYFKKSLQSRLMESYQGLGISYYHLAKYKEARKNIEKAYKLDRSQPLNVYYVALSRDALGKRNTAAYHYKEYLQLNHDDAEMNNFARQRLAELKKANKKSWSNRLRSVFEIINKEIQDH